MVAPCKGSGPHAGSSFVAKQILITGTLKSQARQTSLQSTPLMTLLGAAENSSLCQVWHSATTLTAKARHQWNDSGHRPHAAVLSFRVQLRNATSFAARASEMELAFRRVVETCRPGHSLRHPKTKMQKRLSLFIICDTLVWNSSSEQHRRCDQLELTQTLFEQSSN